MTEKQNDIEKLTRKECDYLLKLARKSIIHMLDTANRISINPGEVPTKRLTENGAVFVTLYKKPGKVLRGCIGSLKARRPLVFDVAENAINSAFNDPRFKPLAPYEMKDIRIEISILTPQTELRVDSSNELLEKLIPGRHGLTIEKKWNRATFLPIVWKELKNKNEFLTELCTKAGLAGNEWKDVKHMKFYTYTAIICEEKD